MSRDVSVLIDRMEKTFATYHGGNMTRMRRGKYWRELEVKLNKFGTQTFKELCNNETSSSAVGLLDCTTFDPLTPTYMRDIDTIDISYDMANAYLAGNYYGGAMRSVISSVSKTFVHWRHTLYHDLLYFGTEPQGMKVQMYYMRYMRELGKVLAQRRRP